MSTDAAGKWQRAGVDGPTFSYVSWPAKTRQTGLRTRVLAAATGTLPRGSGAIDISSKRRSISAIRDGISRFRNRWPPSALALIQIAIAPVMLAPVEWLTRV